MRNAARFEVGPFYRAITSRRTPEIVPDGAADEAHEKRHRRSGVFICVSVSIIRLPL